MVTFSPQFRIPLAALLALILSACATRGGPVAYNQGDFHAPDPTPVVLSSDYKLSPGDEVTVQVYELHDLSGDRTVDSTGRIDMPLIGPVPANNLTAQQLGTAIGARLQEKYLQSPHVTVSLKTAVARTVTIDGSVHTPGVYNISPSTTLIQAIALARGLASQANPKRVVIFRQINGTRKAAAFDLSTIRKGLEPDPQVYPSDVIVVDGSTLSESYRNVLRSIPLAGFLLGL